MAMMTATDRIRPLRRTLGQVASVHRMGPLTAPTAPGQSGSGPGERFLADQPFEWAVEESLHLAAGPFAPAQDLVPGNVHGLDRIIQGPRRDALNTGLLDHRRQSLPALADLRCSRARARQSGAVRGNSESSCPSAASERATRPSRRASPNPGRDARCAAPAAPGPSRHGPRPLRRRPPVASAVRRQSADRIGRPSRAEGPRQGPSLRGRVSSSCQSPSVGLSVLGSPWTQ